MSRWTGCGGSVRYRGLNPGSRQRGGICVTSRIWWKRTTSSPWRTGTTRMRCGFTAMSTRGPVERMRQSIINEYLWKMRQKSKNRAKTLKLAAGSGWPPGGHTLVPGIFINNNYEYGDRGCAMKVFLCEKPAQARDIANAVGKAELKTGFLQVGNDAFTWCVGHLYEQAEPDEYNPEYRRWNLDHLPIVPEVWKLKPRDRVRKQINAIRELLRQAEEVVIATDPDREGEVIGREVLDELRYRGPVRRLLLNALDAASIRKGLAAIQDGKKTEPLYQAGQGRSRADWLVGMNLTRAYTLLGRARGAEGVTPVGRVQTPTLNLVVMRDRKIENFTASDYFTVEVMCRHVEHGAFEASWKPDPIRQDAFCDSEGRCVQKKEALMAAGILTQMALCSAG
ncbi:MAG: hypothetical protein F4X92_00005, partial [Gammaproteobacteria bacterium]|nr:hypothetical protein [Gammaproteobacteria bacterium]